MENLNQIRFCQLCEIAKSLTIMNPNCIKFVIEKITDFGRNFNVNIDTLRSTRDIIQKMHHMEEILKIFDGTLTWTSSLPSAISFDISKVSSEKTKNTTIVFNEKKDECIYKIDIGYFLQGIPATYLMKPKLVLLNNENSCSYSFETPKYCTLSSKKGHLAPGEQKTLYLKSKFENLSSGEKKDEIILTVNQENQTEYSVILTQVVGKINLSDHIENIKSVQLNDEIEHFEMFIGNITVGKKTLKTIELSNPYQIPLRIKFQSLHNELKFKNNELILKPEYTVDNSLIIDTGNSEGERDCNALIYFSSIVKFHLKVIFNAFEPKYSITLEGKEVGRRSDQSMTINLLPCTNVIFDKLKINNRGRIDIKLDTHVEEFMDDNRRTLSRKKVILKTGETYQPSCMIKTNRQLAVKGMVKLSFIICDTDGHQLKTFVLNILVTSRWPSLQIEPTYFEFSPSDVGSTIKKKVTLFCKHADLKIDSISSDDMQIPGFKPLTIKANTSKDIMVCIRPVFTSRTAMVLFKTNCETTVQKHSFDIVMISLCPVSFPRVLDLSRIGRQIFVYIKNNSSTFQPIQITSDFIEKEPSDFSNYEGVRKSEIKPFEVKVSNEPQRKIIQEVFKIELTLLEIGYVSPFCKPMLSKNNAVISDYKIKPSEEVIQILSQIITVLSAPNTQTAAGILFPLFYKMLMEVSLLELQLILNHIRNQNFDDHFKNLIEARIQSELSFKVLMFFDGKNQCKNVTKEGLKKDFKKMTQNLCDDLGIYYLKSMIKCAKNTTGDYFSNLEILLNLFEHYVSPRDIGTLDIVKNNFLKNKTIKTKDKFLLIRKMLQKSPFDIAEIKKVGKILKVVIKLQHAIEINKSFEEENQDEFESNVINTLRNLLSYFKTFHENRSIEDAIKNYIQKSSLSVEGFAFFHDVSEKEEFVKVTEDLSGKVFEFFQHNSCDIEHIDNIFQLAIETMQELDWNVVILQTFFSMLNKQMLFSEVCSACNLIASNKEEILVIEKKYRIVEDFVLKIENRELNNILEFSTSSVQELDHVKELYKIFNDFITEAVKEQPLKISNTISFVKKVKQTANDTQDLFEENLVEKVFEFISYHGEELLMKENLLNSHTQIVEYAAKFLDSDDNIKVKYETFMRECIEKIGFKWTYYYEMIISQIKSLIEFHGIRKDLVAFDVAQSFLSLLPYEKQTVLDVSLELFTKANDDTGIALVTLAQLFFKFNIFSFTNEKECQKSLNNALGLLKKINVKVSIEDLENISKSKKFHLNDNDLLKETLFLLFKELNIEEKTTHNTITLISELQTMTQRLIHEKKNRKREAKVLFEGIVKMSKLFANVESYHLKVLAEIGLSVCQENLDVMQERCKANEILVVFSEDIGLRRLSQLVRILSTHTEKTILLGFHYINNISESVSKILSEIYQAPTEVIETVSLIQKIHRCMIDICQNGHQDKTTAIKMMREVGIYDNVLLMVEYLLLSSEIKDDYHQTICFLELLKSLGGDNDSDILLISTVTEFHLCKRLNNLAGFIDALRLLSKHPSVCKLFKNLAKSIICIFEMKPDVNITRKEANLLAHDILSLLCRDEEKRKKTQTDDES